MRPQDAIIAEFETWFRGQGWPPNVQVRLTSGSGLVADDVFLASVAVPTFLQGQGIGRAIMAGLLAIADRHGAPVTLEASQDSDSADFLEDWYGRLGFAALGGWGDWGPYMSRSAGCVPRPSGPRGP